MFQNEYPLFIPKKLLRKEMLENIRDFPRDWMNVLYQNYSDGIVTGCEITSFEGGITVGKGILCFHHNLYVQTETMQIPYEASNRKCFLKVRFMDENKEPDMIRYLAEICLNEEETNQEKEIELCRFQLQPGARLRDTYVDFEDFSTQYDTINRIFVPFSAEREVSIWYQVLRCFANTIMEEKNGTDLDLMFSMNCLSQEKTVSREFIVQYLKNRLSQERFCKDNMEIYMGLREVLRSNRQGDSKGGGQMNRGKKILLV